MTVSPALYPSVANLGCLNSSSVVTLKSSSITGAGPFSLANSNPVARPETAISFDTLSVNSRDSGSPYFILSIVIVEPRPRKPIPCRLLYSISLLWPSNGKPLISTTLSSILVNTFTTSLYSSQSK